MPEPESGRHRADSEDVAELLADVRRETQAIFDTHILMYGTDVCAVCGTVGGCPARDDAAAMVWEYEMLPARKPGASLPREVRAESFNGFAA